MASKKPSAIRSARKTASKKSAASRSSAKARAKPVDAPPEPHRDYDFEVYVDREKHVRIHGTNQGNIRGSRGDAIRFTYVGRQLDPGFTIIATEFKKNKEKPASQKKQPFDHGLPDAPTRVFHSALKANPDPKPRIFKYTIEIAGAIAADPVIIIDPY